MMLEKNASSLLYDMTIYERENKDRYIIGVDEVGRGPFAGPVTVCAYMFKLQEYLDGVNDSKKLSEKKREYLYEKLIEIAKKYAIVSIEPHIIDNINILEATKQAMKEAVNKLNEKDALVLVDAVTIPEIPNEQISLIKGDQKSISIAAASIIAKVTRDRYMIEVAKIYPQYSFEKHKGYGTKLHIEAIKKYGLSPIHRKTFCKKYVE